MDIMTLNQQTQDFKKHISRVEFYLDSTGLHRYTMKYNNGRIAAAPTKGYDDKVDMVETFERLVIESWHYVEQKRGNKFEIYRMNDTDFSDVEFYKDADTDWRWRASGLGSCTEGYKARVNMVKNFEYVVMSGWIVED